MGHSTAAVPAETADPVAPADAVTSAVAAAEGSLPQKVAGTAVELAHMTARRLCGLEDWPDNQSELVQMRQKLATAVSQAQSCNYLSQLQ